MTVHDFIHQQVCETSRRLRGIGFLLENFRPEGQGDDDDEKMQAVGELLESLGQHSAMTALLIERAEDDLMTLQLKFRKYEHNQLGEALSQIETARSAKAVTK